MKPHQKSAGELENGVGEGRREFLLHEGRRRWKAVRHGTGKHRQGQRQGRLCPGK